ncbi:MAG: hypothetical protein IJS32_06010, partial [Kiritimatiellae bacterium]|nr:hypothetical protein [Kiritimatiellia bacterium]
MKTFLPSLILLALLSALPAFAEEPAAAGPAGEPAAAAPALDAPEAAVALANAYLAALADNDLDRAVALVDMRSMRESLLKTRLGEQRRRNPGMAQEKLDAIEQGLLVKELAPERLESILRTMLRNTRGTGDFAATLSQVQPVPADGNAPVALGEEAYVFIAEVVRGTEKGLVPVPVRRYGDDWQVALDLAEGLARPQAGAHAVPLPPAAKEAVDGFWTVWKEGSPAATYEMLPPAHRPAISAYIAETAAFAERIGTIAGWEPNAPARALSDSTLATGFLVKGDKGEESVVLVLVKT